MITQLKLDESAKLEFGVAITGADSTPTARFIIESKDFSIMLPCKHVNENVEVEIPALKKFLPAGEYQARLEIVLDNKLYTPLKEQIVFEPSIEIETKQKPAQIAVKEQVKVGKVTIKKSEVNEDLLRKTQAAMIVAQSLGYIPSEKETPEAIIENAIKEAGPMSVDQASTVREMLALAESFGVRADVQIEEKLVIVEEKVKAPKQDDDFSDEELEGMIKNLSDEDYTSAYDDNEFAVVDDETGERLEEDVSESTELNEILSRMERIKARVRMARTKAKREIKARIALHKRSDTATLNRRARHMAVKAMEKKLAKNKPLDQLQVSEKERIERIVARRKQVLNRLAMKMVPHVRQVEKDRLSHNSYTQAA